MYQDGRNKPYIIQGNLVESNLVLKLLNGSQECISENEHLRSFEIGD